MPTQPPQPWHHDQPDIANLSPDSFTAQKLVHTATALVLALVLTIAATCNARASASHVAPLLHRSYPRTLLRSHLLFSAHT